MNSYEIEGHCKFRDGKKWKHRWLVVTKLSPVSSCLELKVYKDEKERARNGHTKASLNLENFLSVESGFTLDKESFTLAIICQDLSIVLAFDNRERLIQFRQKIYGNNNLGEGFHYLVQLQSAPVKSKLVPGPVKFHIQTDGKFSLTSGIPPRLLGFWEISQLRRYGFVEGKLVFEGGSRCGKGEGIHVISPDQSQIPQILEALEFCSKGMHNSIRRLNSPRKVGGSRLSELRPNLSQTDSTSNTNIQMNLSMLSPATVPRESRSADELCGPSPNYKALLNKSNCQLSSNENHSHFDLIENQDSISISEYSGGEDQHHQHQRHDSPTKPPMASNIERCLSCMSKLGNLGQQDVLSPSWTMNLDAHSSSPAPPINSNLILMSEKKKGSYGSNSDRLSISSHGSGGGGGSGDFCYDTPKMVLRTSYHSQHHQSQQQQGHLMNGEGYVGSHHQNSNQPQLSPQHHQYHHKIAGNSHCHHGKVVQGGAIFYNEPAIGGGKRSQDINLHSVTANVHASGGFENYDFPKEGGLHHHCNNSACPSNYNENWVLNRSPMDRSSFASSTQDSMLTSSSGGGDFYDTPKNKCSFTYQQHQQHMCQCKDSHHPHLHQQANINNQHVYSMPKPADPMENYDIPPPQSSHPIYLKELQMHQHACMQQAQEQQRHNPVKINGEGKMPLVASGNILSIPPAPQAIYAIVDKTKKSLPKQQHFISECQSIKQHCDKIQTHHNQQQESRHHNELASRYNNQANYANIDFNSGKPKELPPKKGHMSHSGEDPRQNYANMEFIEGHCYLDNNSSNSKAIEMNPYAKQCINIKQTSAIVHHGREREGEQKQKIDVSEEDLYVNNSISRAQNHSQNNKREEGVDTNEKNEGRSSTIKSNNDNSVIKSDNSVDKLKLLEEDSCTLFALRRSKSVPSKGGQTNRGSSSSSDSGCFQGVSGDVFFDDSPTNMEFKSLCLHESLPRKGQKSPLGKSTFFKSERKSSTSSESKFEKKKMNQTQKEIYSNPNLKERHYEVINEIPVNQSKKINNSNSTYEEVNVNANGGSCGGREVSSIIKKFGGNKTHLVSDASSSGASDMSDIESVSSCSLSLQDNVNNSNSNSSALILNSNNNMTVNISNKNSSISANQLINQTNSKPRSGVEYCKIDRAKFASK